MQSHVIPKSWGDSAPQASHEEGFSAKNARLPTLGTGLQPGGKLGVNSFSYADHVHFSGSPKQNSWPFLCFQGSQPCRLAISSDDRPGLHFA